MSRFGQAIHCTGAMFLQSLVIAILLVSGCARGMATFTAPPPARGEPASQPQWSTVSDDWYTLTLGGARVGWLHIAREDDGRRYRTITEMTMSFKQAGTALDADSFVEWLETHDGQALNLKVARKDKARLTSVEIGSFSVWEKTRDGDPLGLLITDREWEFHGKEVTKTVLRGDQKVRVPGPAPDGSWLTPTLAQDFIRRRIADDARAIEYGSIDPTDTLGVVIVRMSFIGRSDFAYEGQLIPVTVWQTQTSVRPGQTTSHFAQDGRMMYSSVALPLGVLETRLSTKEKVQAESPPEPAPLVDHPTIKPDRPLAAASRAVYELRLSEGRLPPLPSAGAQTVEVLDGGRAARITVDLRKPSTATNPELVEAAARERTPIVGSDNPKILELAAQSLRQTEGLSSLELAESSRNVVHSHFAAGDQAVPAIPGVPIGAADYKPTEAGLERARMLCAVFRVHRIASRLVSGLAYHRSPDTDGVFEWQIWTQALIDGKWVDLDPSSTTQFDAAHIATGLATVEATDPQPDPVGFAKLLPDVQITVLSPD